MAFQLVDDALDYTANPDELGKNVGDDLAEGKPTLPLIHAMQHGDDQQQALIRNAIENGGLDHIDAITQIIQSTGALEYTYQQAINEAKLAKQAIESLPQSEYTQALSFLADYSVDRSH
jgi:octaprenyl-diphosphate synthase